MRGAVRSATKGRRRARRQLLQRWAGAELGWRGCWASAGRHGEAEPGWRGCSGWASARNEEKGEGRGSWAGGRSGPRIKEGRERKKIILFLFPTIFQIHFQLDFEFIWILNQNHSSQK